MLKEYIEAVTRRTIETRQQHGQFPAVCTLNDLLTELREDVTECMRQLAREGKFRASININKIPMLLPTEDIK